MTSAFGIGDRVERLLGHQGDRRGTVVRIIQDVPQIVEVSWDSASPPFTITQEPAAKLILVTP